METKNYIKCLRSRKRDSSPVAMRQALCYYLYKENIPCTMIAQLMNYSRMNVYLSIYRVQDLLEVEDKTIKEAYSEINNHVIRIVPCTVDGTLMSRHVGYKMIIDNVIF